MIICFIFLITFYLIFFDFFGVVFQPFFVFLTLLNYLLNLMYDMYDVFLYHKLVVVDATGYINTHIKNPFNLQCYKVKSKKITILEY